ncbi:MAG: methyltransferase domain-containing protein [Sulfuritalea sp.]|nr:methyltransferase domain-containing protein [Sulfuritalea sp.]
MRNGFNCTDDIEKLDGHSFNLITLWDVIEHVPYPKSIVRKVKSLLKKGGVKCLSKLQTLVNWQFTWEMHTHTIWLLSICIYSLVKH